MDAWDEHTANMTTDFRTLHQEVGNLVKQRWPNAREEVVCQGTSYEMAAYVVPLAEHPPKEAWTGTLPHDVLVVGPTEKKAGTTIHIWHPNHPYLLKDNADWLKAAGFKPMVGCLQWNRKAPLDLGALAHLLEAL